MRHVVLASHHRFAAGLADTLEFLGCPNKFDVITAYMDAADTNEAELQRQIDEIFAKVEPGDEVLVLTDVMGGSVNRAFIPYMGEHVFLVAGVNVALGVELCIMPGELNADAVAAAVARAREAICFVNAAVADDDEDDE